MARDVIRLAKALLCLAVTAHVHADTPVVINTWPTPNATDAAWDVIANTQSSTVALDAVEAGCGYCEETQCRGSVGYGGKVDENGEVTLDAMIMDGGTMDVGAVGGIRRVKYPISVARYVLEHTTHTLLVGDQATAFAIENQFVEESLSTAGSNRSWKDWENTNCQPNFRVNTIPDATISCGPYKPIEPSMGKRSTIPKDPTDEDNHDTIGMVAIDRKGRVAAGTSTNGLRHKVPGRVGDSPIPGAGCYADDEVGAAVATGNGDVMMRFLPTYQIVENMRRGMSPAFASRDAINRILKYYPTFSGALIAVSLDGDVGAACAGYADFSFCVRSENMEKTELRTVTCAGNFSKTNPLQIFIFAVSLGYVLSP